MKNIVMPIMASSTVTLGNKTIQLWKNAIWTVKQAQDKFLAAYQATVTDAIPDWKTTWRTDPNFPCRLVGVEEFISALCRQNGMPLTTFNRYRKAARAATLGDVSFNLGANFSIRELQQIKQGQKTIQGIRKERRVRAAENIITKTAAVLPLPGENENAGQYIEDIRERLARYLSDTQGCLDDEAYLKLLVELRRCLASGCSPTETPGGMS